MSTPENTQKPTRHAAITNYEEAREKGLLHGGRRFVRTSDGKAFYPAFLAYNSPFDIDALMQYKLGDDAPDGLPTLNDLIARGLVTEEHLYREYEVFPEGFEESGWAPQLSDEVIRAVIDKFAAHDFNVSREAIVHNYEAWANDYKSGYRDENGGYHLFSPCGCNALRFSATTLFEGLDWQKTYIA